MGVCLLIKVSFLNVDWYLQERMAEHPPMLLFRERLFKGDNSIECCVRFHFNFAK